MHAGVPAPLWRSEGSLWELLLSSHHSWGFHSGCQAREQGALTHQTISKAQGLPIALDILEFST